ncbi:MAG TPA: DUF3307 domain-containing protein [Geminicoccaceae bacterium]|jgi:hypothetical protein
MTVGLPQLLFLLLAAHAVADGPLQSAEMSSLKRSPRAAARLAALGGHSLIHGGAVALVTGTWWLGAAETAAHAAIDAAKCRGLFGLWTDQALHAGCKCAWALIAWRMIG